MRAELQRRHTLRLCRRDDLSESLDQVEGFATVEPHAPHATPKRFSALLVPGIPGKVLVCSSKVQGLVPLRENIEGPVPALHQFVGVRFIVEGQLEPTIAACHFYVVFSVVIDSDCPVAKPHSLVTPSEVCHKIRNAVVKLNKGRVVGIGLMLKYGNGDDNFLYITKSLIQVIVCQ